MIVINNTNKLSNTVIKLAPSEYTIVVSLRWKQKRKQSSRKKRTSSKKAKLENRNKVKLVEKVSNLSEVCFHFQYYQQTVNIKSVYF